MAYPKKQSMDQGLYNTVGWATSTLHFMDYAHQTKKDNNIWKLRIVCDFIVFDFSAKL